ncbi:MAG TPA: zf-HC2 domain-containing protein [Patescibacteria group bacterium]|nr:zf-HC2 domain-containing protein [Patescibacteria group bacterium]
MFAKHSRAGACSAWEVRLEDYVEGRLASQQAAEVEMHTRVCARCNAALDQAKTSVGILTALNARPLPKAGPLFAGRVMAAIRSERRDQELWKPLEIAGWQLCWLACAAALILAVFTARVQLAGPRATVNTTAQQSQVEELINVPVLQPAMQDDALLVASRESNGR